MNELTSNSSSPLGAIDRYDLARRNPYDRHSPEDWNVTNTVNRIFRIISKWLTSRDTQDQDFKSLSKLYKNFSFLVESPASALFKLLDRRLRNQIEDQLGPNRLETFQKCVEQRNSTLCLEERVSQMKGLFSRELRQNLQACLKDRTAQLLSYLPLATQRIDELIQEIAAFNGEEADLKKIDQELEACFELMTLLGSSSDLPFVQVADLMQPFLNCDSDLEEHKYLIVKMFDKGWVRQAGRSLKHLCGFKKDEWRDALHGEGLDGRNRKAREALNSIIRTLIEKESFSRAVFDGGYFWTYDAGLRLALLNQHSNWKPAHCLNQIDVIVQWIRSTNWDPGHVVKPYLEVGLQRCHSPIPMGYYGFLALKDLLNNGREEQKELVEFFLDSDACSINEKVRGSTLLSVIIKECDSSSSLEIAKKLIQRGADWNQVDRLKVESLIASEDPGISRCAQDLLDSMIATIK